MSSKKLVQETHQTTVDHSTGEVTSEVNSKVIRLPSEPPYIKLYIEDLSNMYNLPKNSPELLLELLKKLDYEGQISLNSSNKKIIAKKTNKAVKTLDNFLSELIKKDIFRRIDTGLFAPNPHLFGRGEWREIYKRREAWLKVTYKENGERVVNSSLNEEEQQEIDFKEKGE
jgi:hypothetical protein